MNAYQLTDDQRTVLHVLANQRDGFLKLVNITGAFHWAAMDLHNNGLVEFIQYKGFKVLPRGLEIIGRGGRNKSESSVL